MKRFMVSCDMGSIKIYNTGASFFFKNTIGDVPNTVDIYANPYPTTIEKIRKSGAEFLGHFSVKRRGVFLSSYDCDHDHLYEFGIGRWFVYLKDDSHFYIVFCDSDVHA